MANVNVVRDSLGKSPSASVGDSLRPRAFFTLYLCSPLLYNLQLTCEYLIRVALNVAGWQTYIYRWQLILYTPTPSWCVLVQNFVVVDGCNTIRELLTEGFQVFNSFFYFVKNIPIFRGFSCDTRTRHHIGLKAVCCNAILMVKTSFLCVDGNPVTSNGTSPKFWELYFFCCLQVVL